MMSWLAESSNGWRWFLHSCPFALLLSPAVGEVLDAYRWWEKSQLQIRYPAGIPTILARALLDFDNGKSKGEYDRHQREKRKAKNNR